MHCFATPVPCFSRNRLIINTMKQTAQLLQIPFPTHTDKGCRQPLVYDSPHPSKYLISLIENKFARI